MVRGIWESWGWEEEWVVRGIWGSWGWVEEGERGQGDLGILGLGRGRGKGARRSGDPGVG